MNWSTLKNLLKEAELKIEKIEVNSFFSRYFILRNILQFLAEKFPSIFALNFVIKAKKT